MDTRGDGLRKATATPVVLRAMQEPERAYVIATWLRSYWGTARSHEFRGQPEALYLRSYDERIKRALAGGSQVDVALDPEYPAIVVGFMAHTHGTLHYLYVRSALRRQGVGRALVASAPGLWSHSHLTPDWLRMMKGLPLVSVYKPHHFHEATV